MKFTVPQFKKGDVVLAKVCEVVSPVHLIVEFQGDLIRVANQAQTKFQQGDSISLRVKTIEPLSFQVQRSSRSSSLNVSV